MPHAIWTHDMGVHRFPPSRCPTRDEAAGEYFLETI